MRSFRREENAQAHTHAAKPDDSLGREPAAFVLERIEVRCDRIRCLVRVSPTLSSEACMRAKRLALSCYPHMGDHHCVNDEGCAFSDEGFETNMAHLFEHLAIEIEREGLAETRLSEDGLAETCRAKSPSVAGFCGTTEPVDEKRGLWRVEINYTDDLVALSALREAAGFLKEALQEGA